MQNRSSQSPDLKLGCSQHTKRGNIFWKNDVYSSSTAQKLFWRLVVAWHSPLDDSSHQIFINIFLQVEQVFSLRPTCCIFWHLSHWCRHTKWHSEWNSAAGCRCLRRMKGVLNGKRKLDFCQIMAHFRTSSVNIYIYRAGWQQQERTQRMRTRVERDRNILTVCKNRKKRSNIIIHRA